MSQYITINYLLVPIVFNISGAESHSVYNQRSSNPKFCDSKSSLGHKINMNSFVKRIQVRSTDESTQNMSQWLTQTIGIVGVKSQCTFNGTHGMDIVLLCYFSVCAIHISTSQIRICKKQMLHSKVDINMIDKTCTVDETMFRNV